MRDYLSTEIKEMDLPWEPLPAESGYFMMVDVSKCKPLIPKSYFESHDYTEPSMPKNKLFMPTQPPRIPLDLAFTRWMGKENGVVMMPNSFFHLPGSPTMTENYARVAICKPLEAVKTVCQRLRTLKF